MYHKCSQLSNLYTWFIIIYAYHNLVNKLLNKGNDVCNWLRSERKVILQSVLQVAKEVYFRWAIINDYNSHITSNLRCQYSLLLCFLLHTLIQKFNHQCCICIFLATIVVYIISISVVWYFNYCTIICCVIWILSIS